MEDVVAHVRPRVTQAGHLYRFRLNGALEGASLTPVPDAATLGRGDGRGLVHAKVDGQWHLAVSVETRDEGHAGEYGYMYVDPGFDPQQLEFVQRDSQHEERIDDRWVKWSYDLD
jgi:hypothetical protein